jgi:predicted Zn-dependent peptidase
LGARRTALETGAIVVTEAMRDVRSVAFGLYFPTGSRHETPTNNGISHFIEHLVFKGTPTRSAEEVNREIDLLGGASNAYTSKETLCFHGRVLSEHLPRLTALYGDLASHGLLADVGPEVDREREVILSEISAVEDSPEDFVGDLCDRAFFGDHPLALPIVGSARAVGRLGLAEIRSHFQSHMVANRMVIAAAGRLEHETVVDLVRTHLADVPVGEAHVEIDPPSPLPATRVAERDLEQVHICLSARGVAATDPRRTAAECLSVIAGEGYSSRLFREVRDRRGLAYSVFTALTAYADAGSLNVYLGVSRNKLDEALGVVAEVVGALRRDGVTDEELEAAKLHLNASTVLGHESTSGRMAFLAEQELIGSERLDLEETLRLVGGVTRDQVNEVAADLFGDPLALAAVGPVAPGDLPRGGWDSKG